MLKIYKIMLTGALIFSLIGCQDQSNQKPKSQPEEQTQKTIDKDSHKSAALDEKTSRYIANMLDLQNRRPSTEYVTPELTIPVEPYDDFDWDKRFELPQSEEIDDTVATIQQDEEIPAPMQKVLENHDLANQTLSLNFEDLDIRTVIKTVSEITGIIFIIDEQVKGNVSVVCPNEIKVGELYEFLESILEIHGYAAIPTNNHVKIVPQKDAAGYNIEIHTGIDPEKIALTDTIITQIMPLRYADASDVASLIKTKLSGSSNMNIYKKSNTLLITDTSANIHHIARIIRKIDVPGAKKEFARVPLRYASASTLSKQIMEMLNKNDSLSPAPGARSTSSDSVQIQADSRTNSLMIVAGLRDMQTVFDMIKKLDVEHSADNNNIHVIPLINAKAETIANALAQIDLPRTGSADTIPIKITPFADTNTLIVTASMPDFNVIQSIVKRLDIVQEQISIDLLIVEVSEGDLHDLGIDWATLDEAVSGSMRFFSSTNFGARMDYLSGDYEGLALGAFRNVGGETKYVSVLNALKRLTSSNIISSPNVTTTNHKEASFMAGDNIPYLKDSRITETDPTDPTVIKSYDYKDVGIDMKITPHINQGELIQLEIDSEFTQQKDSLTGLGAETPTISKRKIQTEIIMVDGASIVIGGLIREEANETVDGIPLLSDIPLLGELFKKTKTVKQKTNLLLFITPRIIRRPGDAAEISQMKLQDITREKSE